MFEVASETIYATANDFWLGIARNEICIPGGLREFPPNEREAKLDQPETWHEHELELQFDIMFRESAAWNLP